MTSRGNKGYWYPPLISHLLALFTGLTANGHVLEQGWPEEPLYDALAGRLPT